MGYWIVAVDDEPLSLKNAKEQLNKRDMRVSCLRSGKELLTFMESNEPDLILLDILMPEMDGFETYHALRRFEEGKGRAQTPVIFLTSENNREVERRGLKAGASDFIHKPFDRDVLVNRINNTIANSKKIESLTEEAKLDKLTGFMNKAAGSDKVASLCKDRKGTLMILDLDNFKLVNDIFGHDMGDRILVEFARIVRLNIRSDDVVCRIGGDEFLAYFADVTDREAAGALVKRLNAQLLAEAKTLMGADHGIPLGISAGCAFAPVHSEDFKILFHYADRSLNYVKLNGKQDFAVYDPSSSIGGENEIDQDLSRIIQIISERGEGTGAMLLGHEAFSWNYRFIIRFLKRYGGHANRILFRISADENKVVFPEIVAQFGNVLKDSLRKSDIIVQHGADQFFAVLPLLTKKDTPKVIERIMRAWEKNDYHNRVKIDHIASPVSFGKDTDGQDSDDSRRGK